MEEIYQEREAIYNFTNEEKHAWSNITKIDDNHDNNYNHYQQQQKEEHRYSSEFMNAINKAREAKALYEDELEKNKMNKVNEMIHSGDFMQERKIDVDTIDEDEHNDNYIFTHLNKQGDEISMVDVGDKKISKRIAVAKSSVWFPPEVMDAFQLHHQNENNSNEMIGPKGPIFATARLAGIMGAKRTSDLIPLCHPLPLSKVHIDIKLKDNIAYIECECRVTHKTGVEMEALAGATIAALTIYDMVKAVSHNVRIESTYLIQKSGGKRDVKK